MEEFSSGVDQGWVGGVSRYRGDEIVRIGCRRIHSGRAVAGQICDADGADEHTNVFGYDFGFQTIVLGPKLQLKRGEEKQRYQGRGQAELCGHQVDFEFENSVILLKQASPFTNLLTV